MKYDLFLFDLDDTLLDFRESERLSFSMALESLGLKENLTSLYEQCGYAKPDVRFFEHSIKMAKKFSKSSAIMIGDRLETDILGAHKFGLDSCWFNPQETKHESEFAPTYEIKHLSQLHDVIKK